MSFYIIITIWQAKSSRLLDAFTTLCCILEIPTLVLEIDVYANQCNYLKNKTQSRKSMRKW